MVDDDATVSCKHTIVTYSVCACYLLKVGEEKYAIKFVVIGVAKTKEMICSL